MSLEDTLLTNSDLIGHFTSIETAVTKILFTGEIRFSRYENSTDALESSHLTPMWGGTLIAGESEETYLEKVRMASTSQRIAVNRLQYMKYACFCQSALLIGGLDDVGALRPRMWTQYAESHRGACLIFSKTKLIALVVERFPSAKYDGISYLNFRELSTRPTSGDYNLRMSLTAEDYENMVFSKLQSNIGFSKHVDFESESEFRIAFEDPEEEYSFVPASEALEGILVSKGIDPYYKGEVKRFCTDHNIQCAEIDWSLRKPFLMEF